MPTTNPHLVALNFRSSAVTVLALALAIIVISLPKTTQAQPSEPCQCIPDFITASDINCDGLPLSVADYVLLIRAINGDTALDYQLDSGCSTELDGYNNSFLPCQPNIGDAVALIRYFALGIGSIPTIDCENLSEPLASDLEIIAPGPIALTGQSSKQYTIKLRNNGEDSSFVWGLTVPLELQLMGSDLSVFLFSAGNLHNPSGLGGTSVVIDSNHLALTFYPDALGGPAPMALGPGEEIALADISLGWIAGGKTLATFNLSPSAPNIAPYIVTSPTAEGAPSTEILTLKLENCCGPTGDADANGRFSIADITHLVDLVFGDLDQPNCDAGADINHDNTVNIADITTGVGYIFVEAPDLRCGSCAIAAYTNDYFYEVGGDINLNGLSNEVADWVVLGNYLMRGPEAFWVEMAQLSQSDIDMNCIPATVGDYVALWRIIIGEVQHLAPLSVNHYSDTATVTVTGGVVSIDSRIRAAIFRFPGEATVELIAIGAGLGADTANGYTTVLVTSELLGLTALISGDLFSADRAPIFVEAADSLGAMYQINLNPLSLE